VAKCDATVVNVSENQKWSPSYESPHIDYHHFLIIYYDYYYNYYFYSILIIFFIFYHYDRHKQSSSNLDSRLGQVDFYGDFFSGEYIWISSLLEQRFQYVEL